MKKLSLVIPCYNEEATLAGIVEEVLKIRTTDLALELVIVDDCSRDGSRAAAEALAAKHPEVKLCFHAKNRGKGAALRTGFLAATGDYVGIQDADMEYDPRDYLRMLRPLEEDRADIALGSRYLRRDDRIVLKWWHSTMNRFLTWLSNVFTDLDITDMETCYKLFRREIIQKIAPRLKEDRFGFEPEVAVGQDSDQFSVTGNRNAADPVPAHQFFRIADQVFRTQVKRIRNHAVFTALYFIHLRRLFLNAHVLVDDTQTALPGHGDCHFAVRHRIHRR